VRPSQQARVLLRTGSVANPKRVVGLVKMVAHHHDAPLRTTSQRWARWWTFGLVHVAEEEGTGEETQPNILNRIFIFCCARQFSQDIGEWPENQILIPDWTYFHCPGATQFVHHLFIYSIL